MRRHGEEEKSRHYGLLSCKASNAFLEDVYYICVKVIYQSPIIVKTEKWSSAA